MQCNLDGWTESVLLRLILEDAEETGILDSSLNEECESSASEVSLNQENEGRNCKENN